MNELLTQAEHRLLRPGGLSANDLDRVFARLTGPSIDAADLYFQHSRSESWVLEDGIVKEGSHSIEQGVGVRALSGEKTGFAYSDEIVLPSLLEAAGSARAIAQASANGTGKPLAVATGRALYPAIDPIETLSSEDKIALLREIDALCRLSALAVDLKDVLAELDVNPLFVFAKGQGVKAADALIKPRVQSKA